MAKKGLVVATEEHDRTGPFLGDDALAEEYAGCFLRKSEDGAIRVESNLSTATAAITLFSLISCNQRDTSIGLR